MRQAARPSPLRSLAHGSDVGAWPWSSGAGGNAREATAHYQPYSPCCWLWKSDRNPTMDEAARVFNPCSGLAIPSPGQGKTAY